VLHRASIAAHQDEPVRVFLLVTGAIALSEQAPRGGQLLPTAARLRFAGATTVRVVDRVACYTAADRPNAEMAGTARFTQNDVFVLSVSDLADGRVAIHVNSANFARREADLGIAFIPGHQGGGSAGRANHLGAAPREELDIMDG